MGFQGGTTIKARDLSDGMLARYFPNARILLPGTIDALCDDPSSYPELRAWLYEQTEIDRGQRAAKAVEPAKATFTLFERADATPLTKTFSLTTDGSLAKETSGQLTDGVATQLLMTPTEFAAFLPTLKLNQALAYGTFRHKKARVLTDWIARRRRGRSIDGLPVVSRTRRHMAWPFGAGIFMCDIDAPHTGAPLSIDEAREIIFSVMPALADAPHVVSHSASSFIYEVVSGAEQIGQRGLRFYFFVLNASDIPRVGQILQQRLWLADYGYVKVSASGAMLERTPLDGFVYQAERLDFAAGAHCGAGLEQRRPPPLVFNPDASALDTECAIENLDAAEAEELARRKREAGEEQKEAAAAARVTWLEKRVGEFAAGLNEPDPEVRAKRVEAKRASLVRSLEGGALIGDFVIYVIENSQPVAVTVDEILADRARFHRKKTLDPHEPEYDNYRATGWINAYAANPYLLSFAHGESRYLLLPSSPPPPTPEEQARKTWYECMPVKGSPAAIYLRETFGIAEADCYDRFRWHDPEFAMVAASTNEAGDIVAIEMLALTEFGKIADHRFGPDPREPAKRRVGNPLKGVVRLPGSDDRAVFVARTVEEAIAASLAGYPSIATLVPFTIAHLQRMIPPGRPAALGFPDDRRGDQWERDESQRQKLIAKLMTQGRCVIDVRPYAVLRHNDETFADHLRNHGLESLKAWFGELVGPMKFVDPGLLPVQEARSKLETYLGPRLRKLIKRGGNRVITIEVDCGVGKTTTFRQELPKLTDATISKSRTFGEAFSIYNSAPLHAIHDETLDAVEAMRAESRGLGQLENAVQGESGFTAVSRRGRKAYQPHSRETMCSNLEEIERAEMLGVPDLDEVCKRCTSADFCQYLAQPRLGDLIMVSHHRMVADLKPKDPIPAVVVCDEIPLSAFIKAPALIPHDDLCDEKAMPVASHRHAELRGYLVRAATMNGPGYLQAEHILAAGLRADDLQVAQYLEIRRTIKPVEGDFSVCRPNLSIEPMRDLWWSLNDMLSHRVGTTGRVEIVKERRGKLQFRVLAAHRREASWRHAPTMIMGALTDLQLLSPIFDEAIERGPSFRVTLPHARIYASVGRSFAKTSLAPGSHARDERKMAREEIRKEKLRVSVEAFSTIVQRVHPGDQMLVANKATIEAITPTLDRKGREGVLTGNFNGLIGLNRFEHCSTGIVVGQGAIPSVRVVEEMAQALTGRVIDPAGQHWPRRYETQLFRMPHGRYASVPRLTIYHPNELVDALLKFLGAYQVYQAVYRLRPGNRTSENPATIFVLNNLVLPFPIDGLLPATEIFEPREADRMMAEGGWAFDEAMAASKAFAKTLYSSRSAAQNRFNDEARNRGCRPVTQVGAEACPPDKYLYRGEVPLFGTCVNAGADEAISPSAAMLPIVSYANRTEGTRVCAFQVAGQGCKMQHVTFDPIRHPNLRADLEAVFGLLTHFEIIGHGAPTPRQSPKQRAMSRSDYEANSLSRLKPWESEGIYRRTWERRRKKAAGNEDYTSPTERTHLIPSNAPMTASPHGSWLVETWEDDGVLHHSFRITRAAESLNLCYSLSEVSL